MSFQLDENTEFRAIIEEAIEKIKASKTTFTAYDVTKEVHELVRHKNIKSLVHDFLSDDSSILRDSNNHTVDGKVIPAISYSVDTSTITKIVKDRVIICINGLPVGTEVFLMENDNGGELVLTPDYYAFRDTHTVVGKYIVSNGQVAPGKHHFDSTFPNGYDTYSVGTTIYFEEN